MLPDLLAQALVGGEGVGPGSAARQDDGIEGPEKNLGQGGVGQVARLAAGRDRARGDPRDDDIAARPAQDIDDRDGLDLLETLCQWDQDARRGHGDSIAWSQGSVGLCLGVPLGPVSSFTPGAGLP